MNFPFLFWWYDIPVCESCIMINITDYTTESVQIRIGKQDSSSLYISWGDGYFDEVSNVYPSFGVFNHSYQSNGKYVMSISNPNNISLLYAIQSIMSIPLSSLRGMENLKYCTLLGTKITPQSSDLSELLNNMGLVFFHVGTNSDSVIDLDDIECPTLKDLRIYAMGNRATGDLESFIDTNTNIETIFADSTDITGNFKLLPKTLVVSRTNLSGYETGGTVDDGFSIKIWGGYIENNVSVSDMSSMINDIYDTNAENGSIESFLDITDYPPNVQIKINDMIDNRGLTYTVRSV